MINSQTPADPREQRLESLCFCLMQLVPPGSSGDHMFEVLYLFDKHFNDPPLGVDHMEQLLQTKTHANEHYLAVKQFFDGSVESAIQLFLAIECVTNFSYSTTTVRTSTTYLHEYFGQFVQRHGIDLEPVSIQQFGKILTRLGYPTKRMAGGNCRCIIHKYIPGAQPATTEARPRPTGRKRTQKNLAATTSRKNTGQPENTEYKYFAMGTGVQVTIPKGLGLTADQLKRFGNLNVETQEKALEQLKPGGGYYLQFDRLYESLLTEDNVSLDERIFG